MRKSRYTEEQIIGFIKQAEAGMPIKELCRKGGFSDATFYKWRAKYGGMDVPDARRHPSKQAGLMFHSDRGSQYASKDFRDVLKGYGITSSMSRRGNCWDNACSETLFGSLKVERLYGQRFKTRRAAKDDAIAWLLWYNRTRLHSTLAYVSPVQFEQNWLANQPKQANS